MSYCTSAHSEIEFGSVVFICALFRRPWSLPSFSSTKRPPPGPTPAGTAATLGRAASNAHSFAATARDTKVCSIKFRSSSSSRQQRRTHARDFFEVELHCTRTVVRTFACVRVCALLLVQEFCEAATQWKPLDSWRFLWSRQMPG